MYTSKKQTPTKLRQLSHNDYNLYCQRKLDHYNAWLCDTKRKIGLPYEGFPEDDEFLTQAGVGMESTVIQDMVDTLTETKVVPESAKPERKRKSKAEKPVARKAKEGSKAERAVDIFKRLGGAKSEVIAAFMSELSMSQAGATTYFYNTKKIA
jgi:hypothetical protein